MKTFNYLFGELLGEVILKNTDNLSHTLQHQHLSVAKRQNVAPLRNCEDIRKDTYEQMRHFLFFGAKLHLLDHSI